MNCKRICLDTAQTQRAQGVSAQIRRCVTNWADKQWALKFKEIDLRYQTCSCDSRHCGHMAGEPCTLQLVASEICVTQQADTQQPTKYSAPGFTPPGAV